jgi:hypothetical protein
MSDTVDTPREALIELIAETRNARSAEILDQAQDQARERIRAAFKEARQRVTRAIEDERTRAHSLLAVNAARLETHNRQRYQDAVQHMLSRTRHRLGAALCTRWEQPDSRRLWLENLLEQALQKLPAAPWIIDHPVGWDSTEISHWNDKIQQRTGSAPTLRPDAKMPAGLHIQAGGARLDGSLNGLLADERTVQAKLLAQLEAALPVATGETA